MDTAAVIEDLDAALRAAGTPERAEKERTYLKSEIQHYGVTVPAIRAIVVPRAKALDHHALWAVVRGLWREPVHERRFAAAVLLELRRDVLTGGDLADIDVLLRQCRTWALVDSLIPKPVDAIDQRDHPATTVVLDRWAGDEDFWVRRAALLAHLIGLREGRGDWERFTRYADAMLEDRQFFIRKAIGWVLRDTSRQRASLVAEWVAPRAARMSGVTFTEATRRLPDADRARLQALR